MRSRPQIPRYLPIGVDNCHGGEHVVMDKAPQVQRLEFGHWVWPAVLHKRITQVSVIPATRKVARQVDTRTALGTVRVGTPTPRVTFAPLMKNILKRRWMAGSTWSPSTE